MTQRKIWLNLLLWGLIVGVLSLFFYQYKSPLLDVMSQINFHTFVLILFLQIPLLALGGYPFKLFCLPFKINIKAIDWIGLTFISNSLNHLLPYRPGLGVRYLYLKKHYHIPNMQFIFVSLIYVFSLLFINLIFVLSSWMFGNIPELFLADIQYLASIFAMLIVGYVGIRMLKRQKSSAVAPARVKFMQYAIDSFFALMKSPGILLQSLSVLLLVNILIAAVFYILFLNLHQSLPFAHCCFLVGFTQLSLLFPITPGNIGISEFIIGSLTQQMYGDFSTGVAAMLIFRLCQVSVSVPLALVFGAKMIRR